LTHCVIDPRLIVVHAPGITFTADVLIALILAMALGATVFLYR
jgi:hypothetical protein